MLDLLLPAFRDSDRSHLTVAFGCTGGKHRSVAMTEKLASHLAETGWQVSKRHREVDQRRRWQAAMGARVQGDRKARQSDRHRHRRPWGPRRRTEERDGACRRTAGRDGRDLRSAPRMTAPPARPRSAMPPMPWTAGDGVVVVTDMYGGSPSNLSLRACRPSNRRILTGCEPSHDGETGKSRNLPVEEAVSRAEEAGRRYINSFEGGPE
jgi:hypothetical protein